MFEPEDVKKLPDLSQFADVLSRMRQDDCWCEKGIGNPMFKEHTEVCNDVQIIMKSIELRLNKLAT